MTKRKLTTVILLCIILVIALTGCAVAFPKTADKLIASSNKVWNESATSLVDTYKISTLTFALPVNITGMGDMTFRVDISGGEISAERIFSDDKLEISIAFANFTVLVDKNLKTLLENNGISFDKSSSVNGNLSMIFTPKILTTTMVINGLNLIKSDYPPIHTKTDTYSSDEYITIFNNIKAIGFQTVFGTILNTGKLDKHTNTYAYTLPKENAHDELLRLPKLLIDILGGNKFQDSDKTLHSILKDYFGTQNIIDIANSTLTAKDIKVSCALDKTKKNYYITKLSGNYMGQGALSKAITEKIFDDIIALIDTSGEIINAVSLKGGMSIMLNMSMSSRIKLQ